MSSGSSQSPGDRDGNARAEGGGRAPRGKDGTVSAELSPAILLSLLFLSINKTGVLLKGQEEARVEGSLVVKASVNRRREKVFWFHLADCTVCSDRDQCVFHLWIQTEN